MLALALTMGAPAGASAAGPVERLLQVLIHPTDSDTIVVRYGAATQGFLFSRDGGASFQLMCSTSAAPALSASERLDRVSLRQIPATAAVVLDGTGTLSFSQYGSLWSDDATGCAWNSVPALQGRWPHAMKRDPLDPKVVWAAVSTSMGEGENTTTQVELYRRDASGAWAAVAPIRQLAVGQLILNGNMLVVANAGGRRIYTSMIVAGSAGYTQPYVLVSDDDGTSWREHALPVEQEDLDILAVDPGNPDRVLAAIAREAAPDSLFLSQDQGATFQPYGEFRSISDVTFDGEGRVFLADAGDSSSEASKGGLYTAARLGDPLMHVGTTEFIECAQYQAQTGKLFACNRDRFGVIDPVSGLIEELMTIGTVSSFLECSGRDLQASCQDQLNSGPAWCCAGHYPFTPLCGGYNVTRRPDGGRVFCGLAGREYDQPADAGSMPGPDVPDASPPLVDAAAGPSSSDASAVVPAQPDGGSHAPAGRRRSSGCATGGSITRDRPWSAISIGALLALALGARGSSGRRHRERRFPTPGR